MKKLLLIALSILCFGCAANSYKIKPTELVPNIKIVANIRIVYQQNLSNKLQTRIEIAQSLAQLEKELNIRFDVFREGEFEYKDEAPTEIPESEFLRSVLRNVIVQSKMEACAAVDEKMRSQDHVETAAATICIFENTLTPQLVPNDGVVLGATAVEEGIISLSNLNKGLLFENVMRHEIGHLLGAEHSTDLMAPALGKYGIDNLLPFPQKAIDEMKDHIKNHLS